MTYRDNHDPTVYELRRQHDELEAIRRSAERMDEAMGEILIENRQLRRDVRSIQGNVLALLWMLLIIAIVTWFVAP